MIIDNLIRDGYDPLPLTSNYGDGEESKEEKKREMVSGKNFDYLLSMPLWSLTMEKVEELKREQDKNNRELEKVIAETITVLPFLFPKPLAPNLIVGKKNRQCGQMIWMCF